MLIIFFFSYLPPLLFFFLFSSGTLARIVRCDRVALVQRGMTRPRAQTRHMPLLSVQIVVFVIPLLAHVHVIHI